MKNYSATNTIIIIGKVVYILLYVIGGIILILGLTGYGFDGTLQTSIGLALLLLGFVFTVVSGIYVTLKTIKLI